MVIMYTLSYRLAADRRFNETKPKVEVIKLLEDLSLLNAA